jgi:hypothetical protein
MCGLFFFQEVSFSTDLCHPPINVNNDSPECTLKDGTVSVRSVIDALNIGVFRIVFETICAFYGY